LLVNDALRRKATACRTPCLTRLQQIFEKVGVHTRTELASKIFFGHYWPRLDAAH
jgi:hypothetical protein